MAFLMLFVGEVVVDSASHRELTRALTTVDTALFIVAVVLFLLGFRADRRASDRG
jgi:hypothetical protein